MYFFMISICDAESEFNDGANKRYHLLNRQKELEQLKNIWAWKAAVKVITKYKKTVSNIVITKKKEKQ